MIKVKGHIPIFYWKLTLYQTTTLYNNLMTLIFLSSAFLTFAAIYPPYLLEDFCLSCSFDMQGHVFFVWTISLKRETTDKQVDKTRLSAVSIEVIISQVINWCFFHSCARPSITELSIDYSVFSITTKITQRVWPFNRGRPLLHSTCSYLYFL